ncbi:dephospho-CoA kinase [Polaribacter sp. Z014]|uniref:dephospho-CoA kinase n=1 Tax=unclassified Polaribacter TaxID=196858 RepID=UPI00193C4104|nr:MULTISPECIES: dephospho-CoA kinase [unclassified Polaribacter]MCL7763550.1 dephospho-CoA kinase [Polaribacter sp. Z014]QVY66678.1 dephospho-CoA kinase [Polaribacter sp. Q13]
MVVGLTGGIGSGKTTVANFFAKFDTVAIYNADFEAKKLINASSRIKAKIIEFFGKESYQDNQLNRPFIANLVFQDKSKLAALNAIVHPEVKNHFQQFVHQHANKEYILYENAILFESKSNLKCDIIISVYAPLSVRIERTMLRDHSSKKDVENRIKNQWLEDKKLLQSNYVITNLSKENTEFQVINIHNILTKKYC